MSSKSVESAGPRPFGIAFAAASLVAVVCAAAGAAGFVFRGWVKIFYPYHLNLGEPALAQSIQYFNQGIWPYHDLSSPPFSVVPYGPVFLALSALAKSFLAGPMAGGRAVCFISTVTAAACIGVLTFKCGRSKIAAAGSAFFFMSLPFIERWGVQVNVDMTAVAIELIALTAFVHYADGGYSKKLFLWVGTAAAVAAFFTKSSAVAASAAWAAHLLFSRRWKDLIFFAAVAGGAAATIYAALNIATHGQYYFHTTLEIGRRRAFWQFIPAFWKETVLRQPLNVLAAAVAVAWPVMWRRQPAGTLPNLYLAATGLMTVSLCKQGSDTNYMLPFMAASALAAGRLWGAGSRQNRGRWLTAAVAAGMALQVFSADPFGFSPAKYREDLDRQKAFYQKISGAVRAFGDPIISWDMGLLIANDRPVYFEPFPMAQAAYSKVWDQTPILEDLRAKKFPLIITYFWHGVVKADRNFTPEFILEFKANYALAGRVKVPWDPRSILFFYTPKKPSREQTAIMRPL